jgi:hypothetical protein
MRFHNTKFFKRNFKKKVPSLARLVCALGAKKLEAIKNRVLIKPDVVGICF